MLRQRRDRNALALAASGIAIILIVATAVPWLARQGSAPRAIGGPFSLVGDTGQVVTDRSFPGKYLAIYFGYTHCEDVCPATLTNLSAALGRLGHTAGRVQPLFITVDPRRDSPAVLRRFVANFTPALVGLTGSEAALHGLGRAFHVVSVSHGASTQPAAYVVDHSSVIYLMAPNGDFVAPIPADASEMVMAQALARYIGT